MAKPAFCSDYMEGAHPSILAKLQEINFQKIGGYGLDPICAAAKEKIRAACEAPGADVHFLIGGTQTNATVIDALLHSYQGVIAAESGHIACHEAGAIEFGGHKVLAVPAENGKLTAAAIEAVLTRYDLDETREHTVMPGMVYISQPTEYGTLYSLEELTAISQLCRARNIALYADGARLAYGLGSPENTVSLPDMARLCDVFYIGGTKCGALFGEAVVVPDPARLPHFFTIIKQHGALLAKGWLLGVQFDALFTDGLYEKLGKEAVRQALRIQAALKEKGVPLWFETPTNQVFCVVEDIEVPRFDAITENGYWGRTDNTHTILRFATSWATTQEEVDELIRLLDRL
ncbi:MAG: low specificity L-threonine aldolase [Lachnospiraceae bacterium]|nr:low specificity L-threonine aldolase [Lachnospiraceae bacterium]